MTLDEIAARLDEFHASMVLMAKAIASNAEGDVGYQLKNEHGIDIPALDKLAAEVRKHIP